MPELPEVETTRLGVAPRVVGRAIAAVHVYDRRLRWPVPRGFERAVTGRTIDRVDRRSKYLLFRLGDETLLVHLGMTGSLRVYERAPPRKLHDHVDIVLDDGQTLRYHDPRRFGAMLRLTGEAGAHPLLASLGVEPLEPAFDAAHLYRGTRGRKVAIKLALMDNRIVVGVGNIYASEALFRAGIRPSRRAGSLSKAACERLCSEVRATLADAISKGGSTLRDYVDSRGSRGRAQRGHFVYGRAGKPCRVCGTPIRQTRQGQRSTFWCPGCQK